MCARICLAGTALLLLVAASCGGTGVETSLDSKPDASPEVVADSVSHVETREAGPDPDILDLHLDLLELPEVQDDFLQCQEKPFGLFCPCQTDAECSSGYCIQVPASMGGGKVCTMVCVEDCPEGWQCGLVPGSCPDCTFICIPSGDPPCEAVQETCNGKDDDCNGVADDGIGPVECISSNEHGTCKGTELCAGGTPVCDAPEPAEDLCNGKDDDCDGWVDEATCSDDNPCTDDVCNPAAGCQFPANELACEDGDPCTSGDKCSKGQCAGGLNVCPCMKDEDCPGLGFIGGCVGKLFCDTSAVPFGCKVDPAGANPCPAPSSQCAKVTCNVATGQCDEGNVPDLTPCDDQDACTAFDRCMDGACEGGQPVHCSDANQCTADGCSPMSGCTHEPLSGVSCTDGDPCTDGDLCQAGECMTGPALSCNDDNPCTDDACSPGIGCKHVANKLPCDDGNVCTLDDTCSVGWCISKTLLKCDDGNPCTDEACDPIVGCISTVNTKPCSDGNACTTGDTCKDGVCQPGAGLPCDDGNLCTTDECVDPILGTCTHEEKDCKDFNCCTYDYCNPKTGECYYPVCDCDDHDPCTVDIQLGCPDNGTPIQCKHEPKKCDDGNSCTDDWCDPNSGGCSYSAKDCDDKNGCTIDSCAPKTGCTHKVQVCDDKHPCTENSCNWLTGACVFTPKVCDDGNVCTLDSCGLPSGDCVFVAMCDDGNVCTDDFCEPETGTCEHSAHDCDDGNVCTDDGCEPTGDKGCTHEPAVGFCDDGNPCTDGDACADGQCKPGSPTAKCDDGNACTDDSCDPDSGCIHTPNTAPCDDGNPCNGQDTCGGGVCLPGTGPSCDDGDPCTDDGCQGGVCKHTANLAAQGCSEWVFTPSVSCLTGYAPALDENGTLWAIGTATPCDQGDAYNNDRIVGVNSLTGTQVSMFTIASPASQPAYRQQRITLSLDWNWNSTCGGCQIGYNLPGGGIAWQGGQGPHPRGGISMSADGTMYSSYGSILAIGWGGNTVWSAPGNSGGQGTGSWIMGDGGIIGCANGGTCRKVSSGGASQWQQGLGCNGPQLATDSLGRVVASCWDAGVRVYPSGGGNPVWTVDPTPSVSAALVASEDRVVVGTSEGHVLVLSASGATLGDHALCGAAQFTPWMISSNGRVWGLCGNAKVVAVGLDGSNHYTLATGKNANWVALAKDGVPLVSVGASVYRLKKAAETLAAAPWPTVDHDLQRTRNGKQ